MGFIHLRGYPRFFSLFMISSEDLPVGIDGRMAVEVGVQQGGACAWLAEDDEFGCRRRLYGPQMRQIPFCACDKDSPDPIEAGDTHC